jgi:hypothetical protein
MAKTEIYKVQLSIEHGTLTGKERIIDKEAPATMLVYNKRRSVILEARATSDILILLAGRHKAYFFGTIKGSTLSIIKEAEPQPW